jgi:hypothetical protein
MAPVAEKKSQFWQSAFLVFLGAIISSTSSQINTWYSNRNDIRKVAIEQQVVYEKDVVNTIATNFETVRRLADWSAFAGHPDTLNRKGNDSITKLYEKEKDEWKLRTTGTQLLMSSYVDTSLGHRFASLDKKLDQIGLEARLNITSLGDASSFFAERNRIDVALTTIQKQYEEFMRDFHAAILK